MRVNDRIGSGDGLFGGTGRPIIQSRLVLALLALVTVAVIGYIDNLTGTELSVGALYLVPIAAAAWYLGPAAGRVTAVAASAAKFAADLYDVVNKPSIPISAWNAVMVLALGLAVVEVLARLHSVLDSERALARTDALTGLANGRAFHERAELEIERLRRYGRPFTVACLDLDHFKTVNDTRGHAVGDRLLRDVADALCGRLRRVDAVARLGGDEFAILLPETAAAPALFALEHVRHALAELGADYGPGVRASIGAVTYAQAPASVDAMLRDADRAMYLAKAEGRDRVEAVTMPQQAGRLRKVADAPTRIASGTTAALGLLPDQPDGAPAALAASE